MKKYRIKKHINCYGNSFEVQRKSIFGFWYNYENVDANVTGFYDTLNKAKKSIECKKQGSVNKVVWIS